MALLRLLSAGPPILGPSSLFFILLAAAGCQSTSLDKARDEFYAGRFDQADQWIRKKRWAGRDRLLYLMEHGVILHTAGRYPESNQALLEAASLVRDLEMISTTRTVTSFITTEKIRNYTGEEFERVLIHTYLAMNYLLLANDEEALVEGKRALKRLQKAQETFEQLPFARYVAAICFELLGEYQDATIEYQKVLTAVPDSPQLKRDLVRMARLLGRREDEEKWLKLPGPAPEINPQHSEVIIIVQAGKSPVKVSKEIFIPPSHRFAVPSYRVRQSRGGSAAIRLGGQEAGRSCCLLDLNTAAVQALDKRTSKLVAKETLKKATQEVLAQQTDEVWAEVLVRVAFFSLAGADTRCWETLPREFQVARVSVAPGTYDIHLAFNGAGGEQVIEKPFRNVVVAPRRPAILNLRILK